MPQSPVILIGLDACDASIVRRFAAEGHLPHLAGLMADGAIAPVEVPFGVFVGSVWLNFASGFGPDTHGTHCWDQIDVDTYRRQLRTPTLGAIPPFWKTLGDAGRRVCVIDVPHAKAGPLNGVQVVEWGTHDRHHGLTSWPPERAGWAAREFGFHPALGMKPDEAVDFSGDDVASRTKDYRSADEDEALLRDLRAGLRAKQQLGARLMAEEAWDFFITVYGEGHAVGHQLWSVHDKTHPRHDPALAARLGDPVLKIYQDLDQAVGAHLAAAPRGATVMAYLSHGMGPHYDGTHLLEDILRRLDAAYRVGVNAPRPPRVGGLAPVPSRAKAFLKAIRLDDAARAFKIKVLDPPVRARQLFFLEPNNSVYGGVRFNLKGREPKGQVDPADLDALIARLTDDLMALVNADTGTPLVREVVRAEKHFRRSADDTLPDLFVDWEHGEYVEAARSDLIGEVRIPYELWRTGDHRPEGMLIVRGQGIRAGSSLPPMRAEDIGPTIAARLGVDLAGLQGAPAPWSVLVGA